MPGSIQAVQAERARDEPDFGRPTAIVAGDVALATEVLKVVNSPAFGLARNISSIPHAVSLLGINNVIDMATGAELRTTMASNCRYSLDGSDGHSGGRGLHPGADHDCGIPLLSCQLAGYADFVREAELASANLAEAERR